MSNLEFKLRINTFMPHLDRSQMQLKYCKYEKTNSFFSGDYAVDKIPVLVQLSIYLFNKLKHHSSSSRHGHTKIVSSRSRYGHTKIVNSRNRVLL